MQFCVNRIQVTGKIGVYGRSIGGIAASHLASTYPELVQVFIGDRTMGKLTKLASNRYGRSKVLLHLYKMLSLFWYVDNGEALMKNKECYKILSFDDQDDVVDTFSSIHHSIAG